MFLRQLTFEEKTILVGRIQEAYKNPEAVEELRQAGREATRRIERKITYEEMDRLYDIMNTPFMFAY